MEGRGPSDSTALVFTEWGLSAKMAKCQSECGNGEKFISSHAFLISVGFCRSGISFENNSLNSPSFACLVSLDLDPSSPASKRDLVRHSKGRAGPGGLTLLVLGEVRNPPLFEDFHFSASDERRRVQIPT